jgi:hypothetical protein
LKESTKQLKLDQATAEILGITVEEVQEKRRGHLASGHAREAEAIGLFLETPDAFKRKTCANCRETFLTTYKFVSNCSTECRIASLEKVGIYWNPMHADDMWRRSQIPTEYSIPPKALKVLLELAKYQDRSNPTETPQDQILSLSSNEPESSSSPDSNHQQISEPHKSQEPSPPVSTSSESQVDPELLALGILS